ncbi:hypothetical protein POTOM_041459 [Populus tomentosa]|uniref:FAD-binding PCMH-type domain-containing protein n=1 Tax=Populus tomentosa TaxID=118781 RepID=A0A8X7YRY3_POPTO|nr:hypothetical protein POTOM_041459 [Populus tomentosa]
MDFQQKLVLQLVLVAFVWRRVRVGKTLAQGATRLVHKWKHMGPNLEENLLIRVIIEAVRDARKGHRTVHATFKHSLFLGRTGYPEGETIEALVNIADFIVHPIAEHVLKKLWNWCLEDEKPGLIRDGRMEEISESETSFPYREAILYSIQFGQVMSSNWIRGIEIDIEDETAWVRTGQTLGELYYAIAKKSRVHGFPAGLCPTVGAGGHFTGGGFGILLRKYGLAADNVIDAYLIDVNGRILDKTRNGRRLVLGYSRGWWSKLWSHSVMEDQADSGSTNCKLQEDLFIRIVIQNVGGESTSDKKTVEASFNSLFLGGINRLITLMNDSFPELGLKGSPLEVLLDKTQLYKAKFKAKSDFVTIPIPEFGLEGIWERFLEEGLVFMIMDPFGGRMNEIPESHIPFPHKEGNLYSIQYLVKWDEDEARATHTHVNRIKMLYRYMKPYVSKFPRAAYLNYRDLDLGINKHANTSYYEARDWGMKYFKGNFKRLVQVKSKVDSDNLFRSEQSIPSIHT